MFGIGGFELFLILLFGFLIFGPDRLPEIAKTVGKGIAKFRGAQEDMTEQLKKVTLVDKDSDQPFKNPLDVIANAADVAKEKSATAAKAVSAAKTGVEAAKTEAQEAKPEPVEHSESFAARKARFDRERAARKAAEEDSASSSAEPVADVPTKKLIEEED